MPAIQVPLETVGGLVCCVRPEELPEGASPRNWDVDFMVGRWYQRPGLNSVYSYADAFTARGGGAAVSVPPGSLPWANPDNVLSVGSYATGIPYGVGTEGLRVTDFGFDLPATSPLTGISVSVLCYATAATTLTVQLLLNGAAVGTAKTVAMPVGAAATLNLGGAMDTWGAGLTAINVNNTTFGVQINAVSAFGLSTAQAGYISCSVYQTASTANFNYFTTFVADDGTVYNLAIDAAGAWWVENVTTNPGVLTLLLEGLTPGSFASSVTADDGEFIAFSNLKTGCDLPRKYLPGWQDRVSQVGPGAPPVFTASAESATLYPISSIKQPVPGPFGGGFVFGFGLQSTGPGTQTAGNVVTIYYSDSTTAAEDAALVKAFNSGQPVYVYLQMQGEAAPLSSPLTVQVTSVGIGYPPGQARQFYYFTYVSPTVGSAYSTGQNGFRAQYQQTLATMTTTIPVPQLTVGSTAVVTNATPAAWNSSWPITQTLNSGALAITQSSLTDGVATFSYDVVSGANPTVGELVTITGTLNANGTLNVAGTPIASVSGGSSGTFTVGGFAAATNYPAAAEAGQGTTAGTQFTFDPGLLTLGTTNNPIYGNAASGDIAATGSGQYIGAGTRQGVYGWITRNGFLSPPSPPVTFSCPENTTQILASQLGTGPPNVVGRYIALTEAGANGVPGANFFTLPDPVQYVLNNVTYTATALQINDNVSTTGAFYFPDSELLNATAIDVQGNNLFDLIEIGDPAWVVNYASRNIYGLCRNKLQNFLNLSFDGGYLPGGQLTPLGWTTPDVYGSLLVSPIFGNSYYIQNTTAAQLTQAGLISQSAYEDAYLVPILLPNVSYSVRVAARCPSGKASGALVVNLSDNGIVYGSFTLPFASLSTDMAIYEGPLQGTAQGTGQFQTVPSSLMLNYFASDIGPGADVEIDRMEIFPTLEPVLQVAPWVSYANNRESVDADTGDLDTSAENTQPCYGGAVVLDQLYLLKERSMQSVQDAPGLEPTDWGVHEVSNTVGTCGPNAFDYGDEWLLTMNPSGVYGFNGGRPEPISRELQIQNGPVPTQQKGLWESLNWAAGNSFWLRNDILNRRFYCGVALPTPNFWLPNAPANASPTEPNVILMCNYEGCPTFDDLVSATPVHTTIMGALKALEQKRKWSIWQIASPYAAMVKRTTGAQLTLLLGNGIASGKIYELVPQQTNDDGVPVYPLYTSYGFDGNKQTSPGGLGFGIKLMSWWSGNVQGRGLGGLRFYPNTLSATRPQTNPLALRLQGQPDFNDERKVEVSGQRIFVEISGQGGYIECGTMAVEMAPNPWGAKRGIAL